jgi:TusA-related sulfurtransferase
MADADILVPAPVADHRLDAGDKGCGELLILIHRAIKPLEPGQVLEVVGYSLGAVEDIPAWCRMTSNPLLAMHRTTPARFFIRKGEA